jgi:hypothetical protein
MNTASKLAQLARANQKKQEKPIVDSFQKKVSWGSHQYVRFVKERCKELALKGYGGVEIKIDKTTDLFGVDEGRNSCYSHAFVLKLLQQEGFDIYDTPEGDCYDAQIYTLFWAYNLPFAPSNEKIGMCWK